MNLGFETEMMEYKKSTSELKEGLISLTAMLNKHGEATLYFGVKDNGDICGQDIGNTTLRDVSRKISESIKPQIIPTLHIECIDEKNIIKVTAVGHEKPYSAYGKYYIRMADEDREMYPEQLRLMMTQTAQDTILQISSNHQNLTFHQLTALYLTKGLSVSEETFIDNLSLKNNDGQYNLMAELLSDHNDVSIKVVRFSGKDKTKMMNRNEFGGKCLLLALDQVLNLIESYNETKVILNSRQREEQPLFDMASFKEAWLNACVHNRWDQMNPPAVYVFDDRIEIISTGGIQGKLTKEEFFRGISRPTNRKLQHIFGQLNYTEQTGHGVPLIIKNYGKQAFEITENFINVTIPFDKGILQERKIDYRTMELKDSERLVYEFLRIKPQSTIKDMSGALNLSDSYVRKILERLKEERLIQRCGARKNGYWIIGTKEYPE